VLLELCQQAGLRTPEDVSVVGVGDVEALCAFSPISVSSVSLNTDELGYQAAAVLHRLLKGEGVPDKTVIPAGSLTQRISTGCLALTDPHVLAAVRAIDARYAEPLTMDDLAAAAGVSRRQLYNLFRRELRGSPHEYLLKVRLGQARKRIEAGELRMNEVATACGFNTPRTLNRVFHQRLGVAPSKWAPKRRAR
jgi:LacI family transcriptional regulator